MNRAKGCERARHRRALFRSWAAAAILASLCAAPLRADCVPDRIDERAVVAYVHDGDTLRLKDGRSVRLIGINAPELPRKGETGAAEPHALAARDALRALLKEGGEVALRLDAEHRDRYGRLLAHLYLPAHLPQGGSVQSRLIEGGHVFTVPVPPNLWSFSCYQAAEVRARASGAGIWGLADYRPVDARRLGPDAEGFRIVRGQVSSVSRSSGSWWVNLEGGMALRVLAEDLKYFEGFAFNDMKGREIVARGWLSPRREGRGAVMRIRHPGAIELPAAKTAVDAGHGLPLPGRFAQAAAIADN